MKYRALFVGGNGKLFFRNLLAVSRKSITYFAIDAQVSQRTVRSWRAGEASMPLELLEKWSNEFVVAVPPYERINLEESRRRAGFIGGKARIAIHGAPGTPEGRKKGGINSISAHKKKGTSPFIARKIVKPKITTELAELIGAALGDGGITKYQFKLYSNILDEKQYSDYLAALLYKVFGVAPSIIPDAKHGVVTIVLSRKEIVMYMVSMGMCIGNKTRLQVKVPAWIEEKTQYAHACLKGLLDTDGCVYIDRHTIKGKKYESTCIAFTNRSIPLLDFVERQWRHCGFNPTRTIRDVRLRRKKDVLTFANLIGFSNAKHSRKIKV